MKLNLLPTHVSKEKSTRAALLGSILILLLFIVASAFMFMKAYKDLADSQDGIARERALAQTAKNTGDYADEKMKDSVVLLRNTALAKAMIKHNGDYPAVYDSVRHYIPSFYRVNTMTAQADGPDDTTVTLVGIIDTYQQYADLMLALLRIPNVSAVSRAGFNFNPQYVPAPTEFDQTGKPRKANEAPIPDDPLKRLDYFESQGKVTGYSGAGGFGSGVSGIRHAMPDSSEVTVTIVISKLNIQSPDPRATLNMNNSPTGGGGGAGPGATGGNLPANGKLGAPSATPPANSGGPGPAKGGAGGGKKGKGAGDDTTE